MACRGYRGIHGDIEWSARQAGYRKEWVVEQSWDPDEQGYRKTNAAETLTNAFKVAKSRATRQKAEQQETSPSYFYCANMPYINVARALLP